MDLYVLIDKLCETYNLSGGHKNQLYAFVDNYCYDDPVVIYDTIRDNNVLFDALRSLKNTENGKGYFEFKEIIKGKIQ